jgi:hypothetical protein
MQLPEASPEDPRIPQFFQDMMLEIPDEELLSSATLLIYYTAHRLGGTALSICSYMLAAINEYENELD